MLGFFVPYTKATVRSHPLTAGQQTHLDITFNPRVDRPGGHGELVRRFTYDRRSTRRVARFPLASAVAFFITVMPAR